MAVESSVPTPAGGHLPLMLGFTFGADQKVCNFDSGFGVLEERAHVGHDFADEEVTLS